MVLPSVADALIVVILLVPGFIAFFIIRRIGIVDRKLSDLETIIWSVFFSIIILVPFSAITQLDNIDKIRDEIFIPLNTFILLAITVGSGFLGGIITKQFRKRYHHGGVWDNIMENYAKGGSWITVFTKTGDEYNGQYNMASMSEEEKREIIMSKPIQIIRDNNKKKIKEMKWGEEMIFTEGDIARVLFFRKWDES